eukprot:3923384-Lingulodinium_polyedra.AAC.1
MAGPLLPCTKGWLSPRKTMLSWVLSACRARSHRSLHRNSRATRPEALATLPLGSFALAFWRMFIGAPSHDFE